MKRIIYIFGLILFTHLAKGQVYQSMPQYGYGPIKRMDFDSSLTIPTTCGVPSLRTYITKKAAIAYDSCNKRLYYYDPKLLAWDTIKGGGGGGVATDTTSLSNRINDKIDSLKKSGDSVYFKKNGIWFTSFKDSAGGQNGRWGNDTALVILAKVHNDAGSTLLRGEVVYISGANGDVASVKRANNKYDSTSATTIGIVKDNIAVNDTGWVVTQGQISKINTAAFNPGDIVYMDSIDGKFTKSKELAPYHLVFIGVVERANAGNGQLYIKPQNGYELGELHDVQINSPINNQILVYSDTQQLWKNRNVYSVVDTTKLSARIDERVRYSDTASMLTPYLRKVDTASLSSRINLKLNISDTSVFLRDADSSLYQTKYRTDTMRTNVYNELNNKQSRTLNSYSLIANNTNASAIGAAQNFKDSSGTYSGTITFSGTAPSGTTNHTFRYTQIGKMCILNINLSYTTAASCLSVTLTLPAFCATPTEPAGMTGNGEFIYPGYGMTWSTKSIPSTAGLNSARTAWMRKNASGVYEMVIFNYSSASTIFLSGTVIYFTN